MRPNDKTFVLLLALAVCCGTLLPGFGRSGTSRPGDSVPALFRLTPQTPGYYWHLGEIFNPASNRYFFFFFEPQGQTAVIWCRQFNIHGRPLSGFQKIIELPDEWITEGAVAYNQTEKCMFLVWSSANYDVVKGMPLDNYGRTMGGATIITIKRAQRYNSALNVQVAWLPSVNRYAVAWTYANDISPYSAMNGPYLTVLDRNFTFWIKAKKVYSMTHRNDLHFLYMKPAGNGLLWTGREDGDGRSIQPMAFFTDDRGNVLKTIGVIYPGQPVKGLGLVQAAFDPDVKTVLLFWAAADTYDDADWTSALHYYRIMGGEGVFQGPVKTMPHRAALQAFGSVCYNPVEKRFFWVVQEYADYYSPNPYRSEYKGKLWAYYMDTNGRLLNKNGRPAIAPIPLTNTVSDPGLGSRLWGLVLNPYHNSYWTGYWRYSTQGPACYDAWGLIYK